MGYQPGASSRTLTDDQYMDTYHRIQGRGGYMYGTCPYPIPWHK